MKTTITNSHNFAYPAITFYKSKGLLNINLIEIK